MQVILEALAHLKLGGQVAFRNLTMFPLMNGATGEPDYLLLDEALAKGSAHVTEVSSSGSVPELRFVNDGAQNVLLLDGEELIGAKQNRVLNLTILAPGKRTLAIPVSCVEQGRWTSSSAAFAPSPHVYFSSGRAEKMKHVSQSLETSGERRSRQDQMWRHIEKLSQNLKTESPTGAMADIYSKHAASIDDYVDALAAKDGQTGAVFAINGEIIGLDLFDYAATLRKLLPKLVRSYALDALDAETAKPKTAEGRAAQDFLHSITRAQAQTFPAIGEGQDKRLTGPGLVGAALAAQGRVVHLTAFRVEGGAEAGIRQSRAVRPASRRRSRLGGR